MLLQASYKHTNKNTSTRGAEAEDMSWLYPKGNVIPFLVVKRILGSRSRDQMNYQSDIFNSLMQEPLISIIVVEEHSARIKGSKLWLLGCGEENNLVSMVCFQSSLKHSAWSKTLFLSGKL